MSIVDQSEKLSFGARVELLELDLTTIGVVSAHAGHSGIYRFTTTIKPDGTPIQFAGQVYTPVAMKTEGFTWDGSGGMPRPTLTIADVNGQLLLECMRHDDMVGATITRRVTAEAFLDGASVGDNSHYGPELWTINRKLFADGSSLQFELASFIDQRNYRFPGRLVFRDQFPGVQRISAR